MAVLCTSSNSKSNEFLIKIKKFLYIDKKIFSTQPCKKVKNLLLSKSKSYI